jgi:DNA-binding GntR family transcriptional regulator
VRKARANSKPAAKRPERGSNARIVEEVLRSLAPQAVRPADIRTALQRDKGTSLAYTSIRHALGQLEERKAVEQDGNGGWRIAGEATS